MSSERRRTRRKVPRGVVALIGGLIVLYVVVVALYALSGRSNAPALVAEPTNEQIGLTLRAESVNALGNRLGMTIELSEAGPLDNGSLALSAPVSVIVTENDGPRVIEFPAETLNSPSTLALMTNGYIELWPFDRYTVTTAIAAAQRVTEDDGRFVDSAVSVTGAVPGWALSVQKVKADATIEIDGSSYPVNAIQITASRSGATIAFGIVLLTLMVVMPVLVLTVAILIYTGRRKVEPSLMSWTAAMLFATIPLRTFLPGSPPVGSWIDFLIVLWVIFGLVAGLTIYVLAWRRWSPKLSDGAPIPAAEPPTIEREGSGVSVEERVDLVVVDPREGPPRER